MFDGLPVRTTVDLDEDVLQAAKDLANARGTTMGRILSELARKALTPVAGHVHLRNGVPVLEPRPGESVVTDEVVNRLRDES